MSRPKDAADFIRLIDRWFDTNDVDELDQCSFLATWMGKLLLELDDLKLRKRVAHSFVVMATMTNDPNFLATLSVTQRMDH